MKIAIHNKTTSNFKNITTSSSRTSKDKQPIIISTLSNYSSHNKYQPLFASFTLPIKSIPNKRFNLRSAQRGKVDQPQKVYLNEEISCKSWCLYDSYKGRFLGFRQKNKREIASLTKIMSTLVTIEFLKKYNVPFDLLIKVTQTSSNISGTTASLPPSLWIKISDVLYGCMLPSGNDAAHLLAEYIGWLSLKVNLAKFEDKNKQSFHDLKFIDLSNENTILCTVEFVKMMNQKAKQIKLFNSKFSNPHGLQNAMNLSCPKDIIILSRYAAKNNIFRKIMNTQKHTFQLFNNPSNSFQKAQSCGKNYWLNTNVLLKKGWQGIKTGQTGAAGSCLASLKQGIFIVVLNCKDNEARFSETQRIYDWYISRERLGGIYSQGNWQQN